MFWAIKTWKIIKRRFPRAQANKSGSSAEVDEPFAQRGAQSSCQKSDQASHLESSFGGQKRWNEKVKSILWDFHFEDLKNLIFLLLSMNKLLLKRGIYRKDSIYDKLIFDKIREKFGGRILRLATGNP